MGAIAPIVPALHGDQVGTRGRITCSSSLRACLRSVSRLCSCASVSIAQRWAAEQPIEPEQQSADAEQTEFATRSFSIITNHRRPSAVDEIPVGRETIQIAREIKIKCLPPVVMETSDVTVYM